MIALLGAAGMVGVSRMQERGELDARANPAEPAADRKRASALHFVDYGWMSNGRRRVVDRCVEVSRVLLLDVAVSTDAEVSEVAANQGHSIATWRAP
jgi:hypothetical protein